MNSFIIDGENRERESTLFCSLLEACLASGPVLRTVSVLAFHLCLSLLKFIRCRMLLQNTGWKTDGHHVYLVQNMKVLLFFVPLQLYGHHFLFNFCRPPSWKRSEPSRKYHSLLTSIPADDTSDTDGTFMLLWIKFYGALETLAIPGRTQPVHDYAFIGGYKLRTWLTN